MVGQSEAQGPVDRLLDADAGGNKVLTDRETVVAQLERGVRGDQIEAVMGGASDAERLAEAAGA